MKKLIITTLYFLLSNPSHSLETDQFLMWNNAIEDSTQEVNTFINSNIRDVIDRLNSTGKAKSCSDVYLASMKHFSSGSGVITRIEQWIYDDPQFAKYPPVIYGKKGVVEETIFSSSWLFKWKIFGVNIRVNDVYLGIDKLAHLLETGDDYFKVYMKYKKKGYSDKESELKAIRRGILQERTYYGYAVSGIFSHADLEANYQGLQLGKDFCFSKNPYIKKGKEGWYLSRNIDLKNYVNPNYDESFNVSTYTRRRWKKVKTEVAKYCKEFHTSKIQSRFADYRNRLKSNRSTRYLKNLQLKKKLKRQQEFSLEKICGENKRPFIK